MNKFLSVVVAAALVVSLAAVADDGGFPERAKYKVPVIETAALATKFDNVVVVDVRSRYEFTTLHIQDALNIPLADQDFVDKLSKVRAQTDSTIVVYCNGRTCVKAYQAAEKAKQYGIADVAAYDAGIIEWATSYPEKAVLLGRSPIDPKSDLLSKDALEKHMLSPAQFDQRAYQANTIIVDVRDAIDARSNPLYPLRQRYVPLDNEALASVIDEAKQKGKALLIYDNVGHQAPWLQYFLEQQRFSNYFFLKGGANGYLDLEVQRLVKKAKK